MSVGVIKDGKAVQTAGCAAMANPSIVSKAALKTGFTNCKPFNEANDYIDSLTDTKYDNKWHHLSGLFVATADVPSIQLPFTVDNNMELGNLSWVLGIKNNGTGVLFRIAPEGILLKWLGAQVVADDVICIDCWLKEA